MSERPGSRVDSVDVLVGLGLGMLFWGLWWMWPAVALVVCGGLLFLVGVAGAWRRGGL